MKLAVPLSKSILVLIRIMVAGSAIDAEIQKKIHGSGTTILIISNQEMNNIEKIFQAIADSNILLKRMTKKIKKKTKEQNSTSSFNKIWNIEVLSKWT